MRWLCVCLCSVVSVAAGCAGRVDCERGDAADASPTCLDIDEDGYFDIVADCIMFHEVTPAAAKKIAAETHRILRPGGVFHHADIITAGQPGFKAPATVPEKASLFVNHRDDTLAIVVLFLDEAGAGILVVTVTAEPT